jgi:hypothetical protein
LSDQWCRASEVAPKLIQVAAPLSLASDHTTAIIIFNTIILRSSFPKQWDR